jgi:hypothetical protein
MVSNSRDNGLLKIWVLSAISLQGRFSRIQKWDFPQCFTIDHDAHSVLFSLLSLLLYSVLVVVEVVALVPENPQLLVLQLVPQLGLLLAAATCLHAMPVAVLLPLLSSRPVEVCSLELVLPLPRVWLSELDPPSLTAP